MSVTLLKKLLFSMILTECGIESARIFKETFGNYNFSPYTQKQLDPITFCLVPIQYDPAFSDRSQEVIEAYTLAIEKFTTKNRF